MQSGISASRELHDAFNDLVSTSATQRGLLVGIEKESLVPREMISLSSTEFFDDLSSLQRLLKEDQAAYVILRRYQDVPDGFVAVTYVPDKAHVRQKMLFASTRLTLVRELGAERFRETLFATTRDELTAEGWRKHDKHGELKAPLTEEEQTLQGVKEAESEASMGTTSRSSHVSGPLSFPISDAARQALKSLPVGGHNLVQLKIDIQNESIELVDSTSVDVDQLPQSISDKEPRYSFYRFSYQDGGQTVSPILFIYTCPTGSKIKERMMYASSRAGMIAIANNDAGVEVAKKMEATMPAEITASAVQEEFHPKVEEKQGFSRPKRPGRR